MTHILLVEDDVELAELTAEFLGAHGYEVGLDEGRHAVERILDEVPDMVILDVELPTNTGFTVCRRVRDGGYRGPILFLTARQSSTDELLGFELGGDDFVRKPVDPRILALRVKSMLGRQQPAESWQNGSLTIDPRQRRVVGDGEAIELTTGQFDLLWLLASNVGAVVTREMYYREIRGIEYDGLDRGYDSRIRELRARLAPFGLESRIVTVRGAGYQLTAGE